MYSCFEDMVLIVELFLGRNSFLANVPKLNVSHVETWTFRNVKYSIKQAEIWLEDWRSEWRDATKSEPQC